MNHGDDVEDKYLRGITRRWERLFAAAWQTIRESEDLRRLPPKITVHFSPRIDARLCARIEWNRGVRLVISTRFAEELQRELAGLSPTLAALAFASAQTRRMRQPEVVSAIEEIAVSFILLHEIFHLIGGHLDWTTEQRGIAHFDEQQLGMAPRRKPSAKSLKSPSRPELSTSYVLESEADCNAIQWLVQRAEFDGLRALLRMGRRAVTDLPPQKRRTAFRLAVASVWLIIRKLESSRITWLEASGKTHPLPVTRLFMAFGTFIQEYSIISDLEFDDAGGAQHRLSGKDITSMREFLQHILGPVLKADWSPGRGTVPSNSLEGQMRFYFPDFANHMLNREVTTKVGRQIIQMEKARFRMNRTLKPYRFFPTMELRRRNR